MNVIESSGDVFEDVGFDKPEAALLELRSSLMIAITKEIKKRQINQTQAAKLFGVTQPRISDLKRGKIDLFSLESLIEMLTRAGSVVAITVDGEMVSANPESTSERSYPELGPTPGKRRNAAGVPPRAERPPL